MPLYLRPRGRGKTVVAICGRCQMKHYRSELSPDPNIPGLLVCPNCRDVYDPYKLPMKPPEDITVAQPRPDVPLE